MFENLLNLLPRSFYFITPEISQALGVIELIPWAKIITGQTHPMLPYLRNRGAEILCLEEHISENEVNFGNTASILSCEKSSEYIKNTAAGDHPAVAYFKPSPKLDLLCKNLGYMQLAGVSKLNRFFEDKFLASQIWKGENILVPNIIDFANNLIENKVINEWIDQTGVVIQQDRGWAGQGTTICLSRNELINAINILKNQKVKISKFIQGITYTVNFVVGEKQIWVSPVARQINAINADYAINPATTCGRFWPSGLEQNQEEYINKLILKIGEIMRASEYRGFAGADLVIDNLNQKVYLLEINPRLTASESFFTRLELDLEMLPLSLLHYLSFLKVESEFQINYHEEPINGLQMLLRNTEKENVMIKNPISPGEYEWKNEVLMMVKEGYFPISNNLNVWSGGNHMFNSNDELLKIETTNNKLLDDQKLLLALVNLKNSML